MGTISAIGSFNKGTDSGELIKEQSGDVLRLLIASQGSKGYELNDGSRK